MKPLYDAWLIQIEVTNACHLRCSHCSRGVPHVRGPYFMAVSEVEKALQSLEGWTKGVGCMGGEPTMHPEFIEICKLYQKYVGRFRSGLWTSGGPEYKKYEKLIHETFRMVLYNDHSEVGKHQPLMIASEECVPDEKLRNELIDNCWLQKLWSPAINVKGAFFCEVAAVFDLLFDGPGGYPVEGEWWKRGVGDFQDQRDRYCRYCSIAVPLQSVPNDLGYDYVSPGNLRRLRKAGSPWVKKGKAKLVNKEFTRKDIEKILATEPYAPWEYLGENEVRDKNGKVKGGYTKRREHKVLSGTDA